MNKLDINKVIASVTVIVNEVRAAQSDGKWEVSEVVAIVNDVLKALKDNGVDTGDVAEIIQAVLPIVAFILAKSNK